MKIKISFLSFILLALSMSVFAQKQDAAATVEAFYKFHLAHEDVFDEKEVEIRRRFFTPKLQRLFDAELKRQKIYSRKHPDDKPYFDGLSFTPIEFCPPDYRVGEAKGDSRRAKVKVDFVYSKSSCEANDGTKIFYQVSLLQIGGKWLIDDVIYDDGESLTRAFAKAKQIK